MAERCADLVAEVVRARPEAVLLVPAGSTPVPLYAELARRGADLARTRLFQLDELVGVAQADERSFHGFFQRHLVRPLDLARAFRGLDGAARDPAVEIERHRVALEEAGGADLALLGLGQNGHVAFNEPGSRLSDAARAVELDERTRAGLANAFPSAAPRRGITLGLREIAEARRVVLLVTGASKAAILRALVSEPPTPRCPASLLAAHPDCVVLADRAACAGLAP